MATAHITYPRRVIRRTALRRLAQIALHTLSRLHVTGLENLPRQGPYLMVANHFHFVDPVVMLAVVPQPMEFLGGARFPNAPTIVHQLPKLWGYLPVHRGGSSRHSLRLAQSVLAQDGIVGIFPEGGSWIDVLRPARPGTAFLASQIQVPLVPMGIHGLTEIFSCFKTGKRAQVVVKIGRPFGPFSVTGRGRERRQQLEQISHQIMAQIAQQLPPEKRGHYAQDPAIREAAKGTEIWPWHDMDEPIG